MATIRVSVRITVDGDRAIDYVRTIEATEFSNTSNVLVDSAGFVAQLASLDEITVLFAKSEGACTVRLDGQTDAGIVLGAGGIVLVVNGDIDAGAATNVTMDNQSGTNFDVQTLGGGS